jgi:D-serine deaminase-like pyridoxal phosphate-dependent protein
MKSPFDGSAALIRKEVAALKGAQKLAYIRGLRDCCLAAETLMPAAFRERAGALEKLLEEFDDDFWIEDTLEQSREAKALARRKDKTSPRGLHR